MRRLCFGLTLFFSLCALADDAPRTLPLRTAAPKLDVRLLDGSRAPSWRGMRGHVIVIDFWATWCAPCVAAIPHLDALKNELAGEPVRFYSVTYEPRGKAKAFLEKHPMTTTVGIDDDLKTFTSWMAWGIPMAYVIGRDGKIAAVASPSKLTAAHIRAILAGKPAGVEPHPGWKDPAGAAKYFREQLIKDRAEYPD
ncbi:MAG TPA: TlpA disulfide reductase family protein [Thermoanaerobaculia bacterium]|nr:TlpA disulfide reductase family protein [Thermoanaerobaculia bacterium]